jgi:hypothetical protein
VGFYVDAGGTQRGFIRKAGGPFLTINSPTGCSFSPGYALAYINNDGDIATSCNDSNGFEHGYLRSRTDVVTVFDYPGALYTTVLGISASGDAAGTYLVSGVDHGFIRSSTGSFTSFDFPASGVTNASVNGVDEAGDIFGTYTDGSARCMPLSDTELSSACFT